MTGTEGTGKVGTVGIGPNGVSIVGQGKWFSDDLGEFESGILVFLEFLFFSLSLFDLSLLIFFVFFFLHVAQAKLGNFLPFSTAR